MECEELKEVFGEENRSCSVKHPIVLVFWHSKIKSCLDINYMKLCVNSALLRDASCLDTLNPSEKRVVEIEDGCKVASVNSHDHCSPAPSQGTTAGETKPNLKIYFIELANCHHYNVLWQPSCALKIQIRPSWELLWHVTIIWEMNCDCSGFLRTDRRFLSSLVFPNVCDSCWFSVLQGLLGVFLSVFGGTLCLFISLTSCT